ncbi:MAG: hypothetical protein RBS38_06915 [Bacteroidales bacterium]|nr:hypothetical protein [Bacteroidales bacterium]
MKKFLLVIIVFLICYYSNAFCQSKSGKTSFIDSLQGTWVFTGPEAELWMKVVIKGRTLTGYAAYPESGKFIAESAHKIREVRIVYKSNINRNLKSETFAQIRESTLTSDRIYLNYEGDQTYLVFGDKDSPRLVRVPEDFDPWM